MILQNNEERTLQAGFHTILVKGTVQFYIKSSELSDFIKDAELTDEGAQIRIASAITIKPVFETGEVVII